jgi:hypothetical protein
MRPTGPPPMTVWRLSPSKILLSVTLSDIAYYQCPWGQQIDHPIPQPNSVHILIHILIQKAANTTSGSAVMMALPSGICEVISLGLCNRTFGPWSQQIDEPISTTKRPNSAPKNHKKSGRQYDQRDIRICGKNGCDMQQNLSTSPE